MLEVDLKWGPRAHCIFLHNLIQKMNQGLSSDVQDAHKYKRPLEILLPLPFWKHADNLQ